MAFEFTSPSNSKASNKQNSLIFVGGLTDGFCTVPYVAELAAALEDTEWSLFSILLTSSYNGFGVSSLDRDVEEIGQCVRYIRNLMAARLPGAPPKHGKIVVMGHSTGSQDVLHYLYSPNPLPKTAFTVGLQYMHRPELDGAIMQAPVSDREAILVNMKTSKEPDEVRAVYEQLVTSAKAQLWTEDRKDTLLSMSMTGKLGLPGDAPLSARRFLSLASPDSPENPSQDDLFSSDLSDKRLDETFGMIAKRGILQSRLMVLYSGSDEFCPPWVDKEKLMERWRKATEAGGAKWDAGSSIITGASHNVRDAGQAELISRVVRYLQSLEGNN